MRTFGWLSKGPLGHLLAFQEVLVGLKYYLGLGFSGALKCFKHGLLLLGSPALKSTLNMSAAWSPCLKVHSAG